MGSTGAPRKVGPHTGPYLTGKVKLRPKWNNVFAPPFSSAAGQLEPPHQEKKKEREKKKISPPFQIRRRGRKAFARSTRTRGATARPRLDTSSRDLVSPRLARRRRRARASPRRRTCSGATPSLPPASPPGPVGRSIDRRGEGMAAPEGQNKFAGVRFLPKDLELLAILDAKLRGSPLGPVEAIFHDTQILDFHPYKLYGIHRLDRSISLSLSLCRSPSSSPATGGCLDQIMQFWGF